MEKMRKYAKFFNIILHIVSIALWIVMGGIGITAVFALFSVRGLILLAEVEILLAITLVMCLLAFKMINLFLSAIKNVLAGRPFEKGVADMFHQRGILTIIIGVLSIVVTLLAFYLRTPLLYAAGFTATSGANPDIEINFSFLITAFMYFFVECILRYAEELQTQVDETL